MLRFYIFLSLSLVQACGSENTSLSTSEISAVIDGEFLPLVGRFEEFYGRSIGNISIRFGNVDGVVAGAQVMGYCRLRREGPSEIVFSSYYWNDFLVNVDDPTRDLVREQIMFHELGHCELGRPHRVAMFSYQQMPDQILSVPASIMYPALPISSYQFNRQYYLSELFGRGAIPPGPMSALRNDSSISETWCSVGHLLL